MKLFNNLAFKTMQSSLEAQALKQKVILHNLANYETPDYKAKTVRFEDVLEDVGREGNEYHFRTEVRALDNLTVRPDGNNVDMDAESLELYKNYLHTSMLYQKIDGQIKNVRYVINNALK